MGLINRNIEDLTQQDVNEWFAQMVDTYGADAAQRCTPGGPMYTAILAELEYRQNKACACKGLDGNPLNDCADCPR